MTQCNDLTWWQGLLMGGMFCGTMIAIVWRACR